MKKKGRCKMSVKSRRTLVKTGHRKFRGRTSRQLSIINKHLSRQIDITRIVNNYPVLEVKDGVATNIDYSNPQHLKWLED